MIAARFPNRAALLGLATAALATAAVSLTTLNGLKDYAVAAVLSGRPIRVAGLLSTIGPADIALALLATAACLAPVWAELRHRAVSRLLATLTEPEAWVLLTILVAWFGHAYLGAGVPLGGDTGTHVSRFLEVSRGLEAGTLPTWTNYQYAGAPLLWFTGPLTYVLGGALAFLLHDAVAATKLLLFACHMLSGWMYYALSRRLGVRRLAATVAAAGFAGSFAHLHLFLYRGVVPQALTIVFLILLFQGADRLMHRRPPERPAERTWPGALAVALATAGLIVNHQPHALFAAAYLALFGLGALLLGRWHWSGLPVLVGFGVLGAVTATVAVLPVLLEADWVMIEPEGALFGLHWPTPARLLNLVLWRDTRTTWGIDYWAYLGLGLLAFAAAGLVGLARRQLPPGAAAVLLPACACLLLGLVLYNPVVRDVIFLLFFAGLLAGFGFGWLMDRPMLNHPVLVGRGVLAAVLLAVLDLASTSVQPVMRTDKQFLVDAGQFLERTDPQQRVIQLGTGPAGALDADLGPDGGPISYRSTVQRIAGNHNMAATRLHNDLLVTAKLVETDLHDTGTLAPGTRALLALFNVGHVICNSPIANGCPATIQDADTDPVLGRFLRTAAQPAFFSRTLVALVPGPTIAKPMLWPDDFGPEGPARHIDTIRQTLQAVLVAEAITPGNPLAAAIAVQALPPGYAPPPPLADWTPRVLDHQVSLTRVRLRVQTAVPAWVQMPHPWFPSTRVTVNGIPTQPLRGTLDLMVVPVPAGDSCIVLRDATTPVRTASLAISLAGLLAIALATALLARRERAEATLPPL